MKTIIAIDPGPVESALVSWDGERIGRCEDWPNQELLRALRTWPDNSIYELHIEMMAGMGMAVGKSVFDTCVWIGKFCEAFKGDHYLVYRRDVKLHHCGQARAKDGNVAQALRDKYGEKGTKANPGTTYGLSKHLWQAFAIATYVTEIRKEKGAL